jgi:hypothetical protein
MKHTNNINNNKHFREVCPDAAWKGSILSFMVHMNNSNKLK